MSPETIAAVVIAGCMAFFALILLILWAAEERIAGLIRQITPPDEICEETELVRDPVYIRVHGGRAGILRELPVRRISEEVRLAEPVPVIEPYEEAAAVAAAETSPKEEEDNAAIEKFVERYGTQISENSRLIEVSEPETGDFAERYQKLSDDIRRLFDEFAAYAEAKENVRVIRNRNNMTFKYRTERLLRAVIRRGIPVLQFQLVNNELKRFIREDAKKEIRVSPVNIRLTSESELEAAKQTADITAANIEEEYEYNRERRRALRAERNRLRREAGGR